MSIKNIRHKGMRKLFEQDKKEGVPSNSVKKLKSILSILDEIKMPDDLNGIPGLQCHPLIGNKKGFYSIKASGNTRVVFRIFEEDVFDVDLMDYH